MNCNNQNDHSKDISQEEQEGEKYSNFYPKLVIASKNQDKTEAVGDSPIPHNPVNNSQKKENMPDKISEKEMKQESNAIPLPSSLPTEEAKQPGNELKPIENEPNQQEIYDDLQNQINQQNTNNLMEMEIEEEELVVDSKEFGKNNNTTEVYTELNQNQSEINLESPIFDIDHNSQNPYIYIPIQSWDKVSNMHSVFDNVYSDFYDYNDERLNFYGDYKDQFGVNG